MQLEQLQTKQTTPVLQLEIAHPQKKRKKKQQRPFATCIGQTSFTFPHKYGNTPGLDHWLSCYKMYGDFGNTESNVTVVSRH